MAKRACQCSNLWKIEAAMFSRFDGLMASKLNSYEVIQKNYALSKSIENL